MSEYLNFEKALARNCSVLGDTLGETYTFLLNDFFTTLYAWDMYRSLFAQNEERVDLLNAVSGPVALVLSGMFYDMTLLRLRRLTETMRGAGPTSRLCLDKLVHYSFPEHKQELAALKKICIKKTKFAKHLVDNKVAHHNLGVRKKAAILPIGSRKDIEASLEAIAHLFFVFAQRHLDTHLSFEIISSFETDEIRFLETLYLGNLEIAAQRDRLRAASQSIELARDYQEPEFPNWLSERTSRNWNFES